MLSNVKIPKRKYYLILIFTSAIIMSISLETMFRVKDIVLFEEWIQINNISVNSDYELSQIFNSYLILGLGTMFMKIIIPMALSIHSYFAYTRIRINRLFIFIWSVLLVGGLAYELIGFNLGSIFSYLNIIVYIVLIITILSLNSVIDISIKG